MDHSFELTLAEKDVCRALEAYLNRQLLPQARIQVRRLVTITRVGVICDPTPPDLEFVTSPGVGYAPEALPASLAADDV